MKTYYCEKCHSEIGLTRYCKKPTVICCRKEMRLIHKPGIMQLAREWILCKEAQGF